jgi:hypothetical protein
MIGARGAHRDCECGEKRNRNRGQPQQTSYSSFHLVFLDSRAIRFDMPLNLITQATAFYLRFHTEKSEFGGDAVHRDWREFLWRRRLAGGFPLP